MKRPSLGFIEQLISVGSCCRFCAIEHRCNECPDPTMNYWVDMKIRIVVVILYNNFGAFGTLEEA
jgi:hypothetical protein